MKKRVRIYQDGGAYDPMQQMEQQQPVDDTQLIEGILQELGQGSSLADVNYKLVQGGVPQQKAQMLIGQVAAYLQQQKEDEAASLENTSQEDPEADEAAAQAKADAEAVEQENYNAQMQQMYADSAEANTAATDDDTQPMMRYGGIPSKKSFIKSYMDNYKKQQGGSNFDPSTDIPIDGRAEQLQKFLGSVKSTAENAALREQAEQAYEQQMQAPIYDEYTEMPEAQFGGGLFGRNARRAQRKLNRMMPAGLPMGAAYNPQGLSNFIPGYGLANIEVHKTGLFGRPKQYTINFANMPFTQKNVAAAVDQATTNAKESSSTTEPVTTTTTTTTESSDKPVTFTTTPTAESTKSTESTTTTTTGNTGTTKTDTTKTDTTKVDETPVVEDKKQEGKKEVPSKKGSTKNPNLVTYHTYVNQEGNVDGSRDFLDPNKEYSYDWKTKQWYRGNTLIKDTKAIGNLNNWMKKGLLERTQNLISSQQMAPGYDPAIDPRTGKRRPMSALADDDLVAQAALMGASPSTALKKIPELLIRRSVQNQLNPGQNMLNPGQNQLNPGQGMLNPGQGMLNRGQGMLNPPPGHQFSFPFQQGGFTDQASGLYKFFGGGEDPSIPQLDIDDLNTKNTADPYFAYGGVLPTAAVGDQVVTETKKDTPLFSPEQEAWLKQNYGNMGQQQQSFNYGYPQVAYSGYNPYLSAIAPGFFGGNRPVQYAGSWAKMIGSPYMTGTDNPALNLMGPNTRISSIDVKKTGMLSRMPKKYTVNFSNYVDNTAPIFTDKPGTGITTAQDQTTSSGPGVSPDADKYDGLNVRQAKRKARGFKTPDNVTPESLLKFQIPTEPIDDSGFAPPVEDPIRMSFQTPTQSTFDPSAVSRSQGQRVMFDMNSMPVRQNQQTPSPELQIPSKYKNLITTGPTGNTFTPDPYTVMGNPGNAVISPRTVTNPNINNAPINYSGPMNIPQSVTAQTFGYEYGGYLPQAQTGNFPAMQLPLKDTRKDKSVSSYKGPKYNVPTQKNIPSETTQKVGNYARSAGADQQRSSELRMQAAKDIAAKSFEKYGESYQTALDRANKQVNSGDFNPGEYLQGEAKKEIGSGPMSSAVVKASTPQSDISRAWEYITNPLTALKYEISGGGYENMPHNINAMRMAGIESESDKSNLVGNALNSFNAADAADKVVGNAKKGNYLTAGAEALRLIPAGKALQAGAQEFNALRKSGALGSLGSVAEGVGSAGTTAAGALHLHDAAGLLKEKALHAGAHEADHYINELMGVAHHAYGGEYAYGGYLPQAAGGEEVKVFTSRPEYAGISNVEMTQKDIAPNTEFKAPEGSTFNWSGFSNQEVPVNNQKVTDPTAAATMDLKIDPNQANRDNIKKSVNEQKWSADFKTKNQWNIDPEAALNVFNAGARGLASFIGNSRAAQRQNQYMQNNMNSDALFAANEHTNRGTYDTNSGLFRPDEMGFTGVAAYGGMFQDGGYYDQSDEVYMTEDEINDFLANGGELEYIND